MQETLKNIEEQSKLVMEVVDSILGKDLESIDQYLTNIKQKFSGCKELTDLELDEIIFEVPLHLYYLYSVLHKCELRKGLADESKSYKKNEAILNATGTVQEKTSKAELACSEGVIVFLAYKNACDIIRGKMDSASELLNSAKKIQSRRVEEMRLSQSSKNGGTF